jgi:hypothetical protein
MLCSSSCNKSFWSHFKTFCAFLLFSLAPGLWKVLLGTPQVRRSLFQIQVGVRPFEIDVATHPDFPGLRVAGDVVLE